MRKGFIGIILSMIFLVSSLSGAIATHDNESETASVGFEELAGWAIKLDTRLDKVQNPERLIPDWSDEDTVEAWVKEVVPFFGYEGVIADGVMSYPKSVEFVYYDSGLWHNHLMGTTDCFVDEVTLNGRFQNQYSSAYNSPTVLGTLVHELAHVQGICFVGDKYNAEASTQLVTLEILAAMANRGNEYAMYSLAVELRTMLMAAAKYVAIHENRMDDYDNLKHFVYGDEPFRVASVDKSARYWESNPELLEEILRDYNYLPMVGVLGAYYADSTEIHGVVLPINRWCLYYTYDAPNYSSSSKSECELYPLVVDDLMYVLNNLTEMMEFIWYDTR